ncbi:hypothetical protein TELCIR_12662 [Teladorsagia circumcincta]|uniref:Uncharacterized protein n=1 Tax=Teladorsagia circumcincta TaxID=45464 RepID=A0A2G9U5T3_TELCI|nr:hypothetical protein TELCIR_12662 [Teladorsagia circumcincta]
MIIKDKFDGASEVTIEEEEDDQPRIVMKNSQFKRHTNADLRHCRCKFRKKNQKNWLPEEIVETEEKTITIGAMRG